MVLNPEYKRIIVEALEKHGPEHQLRVVQEEMAEVIVSISHFLRKRCSDKEVIEELADAQIMIDTAVIILKRMRGEDLPSDVRDEVDAVINAKMKRLEYRLSYKGE